MMLNNSFDTGFNHMSNAQQGGGGDELHGHYVLSHPEDDEEYLEYYNVMINSFINSSAAFTGDVHPDEISTSSLSFKSSSSSSSSDLQHPTTNPPLPPLPDHDQYQDPVLLYLQDDCNNIVLDDGFSSSCINNNTTNVDDLFPLNGFNLLPSSAVDNFSVLSSNDQPYIDHHNLTTSFSSTGSSNYNFNSSSSAPSYNCFSSYNNSHYPKRQKTSNNGSSSSFYFDERSPFVDSNPYLNPSIFHHYDHFLLPQLFLPPTNATSDQSMVANKIPTSVGFYSSSGDHTCNNAKRFDIGAGGVSSSSQSLAARQRRKKITDKTQELGRLIPGGPKMSNADMFRAAYKYVKFLQAQVGILELMAAATQDNQKNKENSSQPLMKVLLASPAMHEKMSSEEKCLVSREFIVDMLKEEDETNHERMSHDQQQQQPPSSSIVKDLNSLLLQP